MNAAYTAISHLALFVFGLCLVAGAFCIVMAGRAKPRDGYQIKPRRVRRTRHCHEWVEVDSIVTGETLRYICRAPGCDEQWEPEEMLKAVQEANDPQPKRSVGLDPEPALHLVPAPSPRSRPRKSIVDQACVDLERWREANHMAEATRQEHQRQIEDLIRQTEVIQQMLGDFNRRPDHRPVAATYNLPNHRLGDLTPQQKATLHRLVAMDATPEQVREAMAALGRLRLRRRNS